MSKAKNLLAGLFGGLSEEALAREERASVAAAKRESSTDLTLVKVGKRWEAQDSNGTCWVSRSSARDVEAWCDLQGIRLHW